jgi:hypothetical protein
MPESVAFARTYAASHESISDESALRESEVAEWEGANVASVGAGWMSAAVGKSTGNVQAPSNCGIALPMGIRVALHILSATSAVE